MTQNQIDNNNDKKDDNKNTINDTDLQTTETDMMFDYFANEDKLVSEDKLKGFDKNNLSPIEEQEDNLSDYCDTEKNENENSDSDLSNKNNNENYSNENNNTNYNYQDSYNNTNNYDNYENNKNTFSQNNDEFVSQAFNNQPNGFKTETKEDMMLKKLDMLRKLGELTQYGVKLSQNYNMNSDYKAMEYEYELHKSIRAKRNSINWMSSMMLNCVYGLEMANEKYDPFSLKLQDWSKQMSADIKDYYDVFGELYEKYNRPGKSMPPELKLVLMVSGSALKFHLTNQMLGSLPNLNSKMKEHPELAEKLREQAMKEKLKQNNAMRENYDKSMMKEQIFHLKKQWIYKCLKNRKSNLI